MGAGKRWVQWSTKAKMLVPLLLLRMVLELYLILLVLVAGRHYPACLSPTGIITYCVAVMIVEVLSVVIGLSPVMLTATKVDLQKQPQPI